MRGFLFGMCLGAIAGVLCAPATGSRTRSLIRDKYSQLRTDGKDMLDDVQMLVNEQSGPLKEKMMGMRDDMRMKMDDMQTKLSDVRGKVEEKVGEIKGQIKSGTQEQGGEDQFRQSA
jgi:gas vesicle protein